MDPLYEGNPPILSADGPVKYCINRIPEPENWKVEIVCDICDTTTETVGGFQSEVDAREFIGLNAEKFYAMKKAQAQITCYQRAAQQLMRACEMAARRFGFAANWIENSYGGSNKDVELVRSYARAARRSSASVASLLGQQVDYDGRIIAAAPELLEACKIAVDALGCDRVREDRLRAQEIIHKAINRAKGG